MPSIRRKIKSLLLSIICLLVFAACSRYSVTETRVTSPAQHSAFPQNTAVPSPTAFVPEVTDTPAPTNTPIPTPTPVPNVAFVNGDIPVDAREITLIIEQNEFGKLAQFPELNSCHFEGSSCYDAIIEFAGSHPGIIVTYDVDIKGISYPSDTTSITAAPGNWSISDINNAFKWLPSLSVIDMGGLAFSAEECTQILDRLGTSVINYKVQIGNLRLDSNCERADLTQTSLESVDDLITAIHLLPDLSYIDLSNASSKITIEEVGKIQQAKQGLIVDYPIKLYGKQLSTADKYIILSNKRIKVKQLNELRKVIPYMTNCEKLVMDGCGLSDEVMDELRTELEPYTEVVWRIKCGPYSCRTDAVMIKFAGKEPALTDAKVKGLFYCHDVVYLDLGHNHLRNIDFVAGMPNLQVCIVAVNYLRDISAIQNCKQLEYCEFLSNGSIDVTPLAACTELKHLNISYANVTDITPLYGLTKLERLWISRNKIPKEQIDTIKDILPNAEINTTAHNCTGEGWRENPRYDLLRQQFRYDNTRVRSCYMMDGEMIEDGTK